MRFLVALLLLLLLVGCTSSSSITAAPLDGNGGPYYGTVENSKKGKFKLDVDGKLYQGYWNLGLGTTDGVPTGIGGASTSDGSKMTCVFQHPDRWSAAGTGICTDNGGRVFTLVIKDDG